MEETKKKSRGKRVLIGFGIAFALIISVCVLVYAYENWSGAREWNRVRQKLVDGNVELDARNLVKELPPAEKNFGSVPMLLALTDFEVDENDDPVYRTPELVERYQSVCLPEDIRNGDNPFAQWETAKRADLPSILKKLKESGEFEITEQPPAAGILEALDKFSPVLDELDQAAQREEAVLQYELGSNFMEIIARPQPYLFDLKKNQELHLVRAFAELEAGDSSSALATLMTLRQNARLCGSQPLLINHLMRNAFLSMFLSAVWSGLAADQWEEGELEKIEQLLAGLPEEHLDNLEAAMSMEMTAGIIGACDYLRSVGRGNELLQSLTGSNSNGGMKMALPLVPDGLWDHNKAFGAEFMYDNAIVPIRERRLVSSIEALTESGKKRSLRRLIPMLMIPATDASLQTSFATAVSMDMARVACSLERYKRIEGGYPAELADLVPSYIETIPVDLFDLKKEPVRYLKDGDRYRVYSVGNNGEDDGGKISFRSEKRNRRDRKAGDLVWGYDSLSDSVD